MTRGMKIFLELRGLVHNLADNLIPHAGILKRQTPWQLPELPDFLAMHDGCRVPRILEATAVRTGCGSYREELLVGSGRVAEACFQHTCNVKLRTGYSYSGHTVACSLS